MARASLDPTMPGMNHRTSLLRAATGVLVATWIGQGVIALTHTPSGNHSVEGFAEHLQLALLTTCALALIPIVSLLGRLAAAPRPATLALAGACTLGTLSVISNVNGEDASFFTAVAVPSMLSWLVGFVLLGVALARSRALPRHLAIGLPVAFVAGAPLGHLGGGLITAVYWTLVAAELGLLTGRPRAAAVPAH